MLRRLSFFLGITALLICLSTWVLDLNDLVEHCIYCRNERTIIGLLGLLLVLPNYRYLSLYLSLVFGFYGASVSAQHIMLIMINNNFYSPTLILSMVSLFIIIGLVFFISHLQK